MMLVNHYIDISAMSFNHFGEELCGDNVIINHLDNNVDLVVLADGLGSGVQASILSILTSTLLSKMFSNNISIEECVSTIAQTLPYIKEKKASYCTFTIIKITDGKYVEIYNYDNPQPFLVAHHEAKPIEYKEEIIENKRLYIARFEIKLNDAIIALSDGVTYAGTGDKFNFGFDLSHIMSFMGKMARPEDSASSLNTFFMGYVKKLYNNQFGDDASCVFIKIRPRQTINLMVGPPTNPSDDDRIAALFMSKPGLHIVCGGTTSKIIAHYLDKPVIPLLQYEDKNIPPISTIEGVDLVTEGIVTLNKVLKNAQSFLNDNNAEYFNWFYHKDGASLISKYLLDTATEINIYAGCAINEAHQKGTASLNHAFKMHVVDELSQDLKKMNKCVRVTYY